MGGLLILGMLIAPPALTAGVGGLIVAVRQDRRSGLLSVGVVAALWLFA